MAEKAQNKGDVKIAYRLWVPAGQPSLLTRDLLWCGGVFRRARVIRPSDRPLVRLVAIATFMAALTLAGCGRKGGLDAPPSSLPASPSPQASNSPSLGDSSPGFFGPSLGNATAPSGPQNQTAQSTPPSQKKSFILDWLIN
jgi:predicted small lipoprotein YifL